MKVLLATVIIIILLAIITTILVIKENAATNSDPNSSGGLFKQLNLRTLPIERLRLLWLNCRVYGFNKDNHERKVLSKTVSSLSRNVLISDISKLTESEIDNIYIAYCKSKDSIENTLDTVSTEDKIQTMYKENFI
jgi:hypothetical protein